MSRWIAECLILSALAAAMPAAVPFAVTAAEPSAELPKGWLLWHSYSDYSALDSQLYLRDPDGRTENISGDFIHPMNGSFGTSPHQITFMAIDKETDEWDIYIRENGSITNLTKNSGFRNEDPKFSPDGRTVVFKRGRWDNEKNDFVYDLALLEPETGDISMLTADSDEEAMPCFDSDGSGIYYADYSGGMSSIRYYDTERHDTCIIYGNNSVSAYYPVVSGQRLYFTKWYSADDRCDQIVYFNGTDAVPLPFDSADYDCSDACPVDEDRRIFSSTMSGGYDLYYYDGSSVFALSELNSDKNELGADFYSYEEYLENSFVRGDVNDDGEFGVADLVIFQKWLLADKDTKLKKWRAADLCRNNRLDVYDLVLMRKELLMK